MVGVPFGTGSGRTKRLLGALRSVDTTFRYDTASWLPKNGYVRAHKADLVVFGSDQESDALDVHAQTVILASPSAPRVPIGLRSSAVCALRAGVVLSGLEVVNPVYVLLATLLWDIVLSSTRNPRDLIGPGGIRTGSVCFGVSAVAVKCVLLGPLHALGFVALLLYEAYRESVLGAALKFIPIHGKETR